jgi:peptidoglycan/xylan/chitin deacetylase (PgdA/CDA1 family)
LTGIFYSIWDAISPLKNLKLKDYFTFIHYHTVEPEVFRKHIEFLSQHFSLLDLEELKKHVEKRTPLQEKSLFITFDDGWLSNYDLLPIFEEKKAPVTIFLTTSLIGTNKRPPPISNYQNSLDIGNIYETELERIMLNYEEIKEMSKIVNFQSHGVHHIPATHISPDQLRWELLESKKIIEDISGNPVYAFAYPYNRASENEAKLVESCGYLIARKGGRMLNKSGENYFLINSIGVENNCSVKELQKKILKAEFKTILNPQ